MWIADFNFEYDLIIIVYIRNLQSEIRNPLAPLLQHPKPKVIFKPIRIPSIPIGDRLQIIIAVI